MFSIKEALFLMETIFLLRNFCDRGPRGSQVFACLQYAFSLYIGSNSTLCIWFSFVILHSQCSHSLHVYWHLHPWGFLKFLLVALNIWKDVKDHASIMSAYFWHVWLIASLLSANVSFWMTPNFFNQNWRERAAFQRSAFGVRAFDC